MKKTQTGGRIPWNKGLVAGQKHTLNLDEIAQIETQLLAQENWHDLALLSLGLDTMFRAIDLLTTKVWHMTYPNGAIRSLIAHRRRKTRHVVNPVLTPPTLDYLHRWLKVSGNQNRIAGTRQDRASGAICQIHPTKGPAGGLY